MNAFMKDHIVQTFEVNFQANHLSDVIKVNATTLDIC